MEELIQFFHSSNLVSREKAEEIAAQFFHKPIVKNDYFLKERQISNEYLFLEHGAMRSFAYDANRNEVTTGFHFSGQVVFEVSSFLIVRHQKKIFRR